MEKIGKARNMLENKAISEKRTVNENSMSAPPSICNADRRTHGGCLFFGLSLAQNAPDMVEYTQ